jgi:hypothetical protein
VFRSLLDAAGGFELGAVWSADGKLLTGEACAEFMSRLLTAKFAHPRELWPDEWDEAALRARVAEVLPRPPHPEDIHALFEIPTEDEYRAAVHSKFGKGKGHSLDMRLYEHQRMAPPRVRKSSVRLGIFM